LNPNYQVIKVSAKSNPNAVAGYLAPIIREAVSSNPLIKQYCELSCIGAGATNQGIKAVAIASGMVKPNGIDIATVAAFADITVKDEERTALRLIVVRN
jgi:stage V sporulation protein S